MNIEHIKKKIESAGCRTNKLKLQKRRQETDWNLLQSESLYATICGYGSVFNKYAEGKKDIIMVVTY